MDDFEKEIDGQWYSDAERLLHLKAWEMSSIEILLKSWAEKAGGLRWMHIKSSNIWRKLDTKLNYFGIILSSIVSATSMLGAMENIISKETMMVFVGLLGVLNIISQSFIKFYNSSEKAALHDTAARQFGNFNRYIATKLSMSRIDRGPPNEILKYALKEYERLYNENPDPHPDSIEMFKHFIKHQEAFTASVSFAVPDLINSSFYVNIHDQNPIISDDDNKNQTEQKMITETAKRNSMNLKRMTDFIKTQNFLKNTESFDTMKKIYSSTPSTPMAKRSLDDEDAFNMDESAV